MTDTIEQSNLNTHSKLSRPGYCLTKLHALYMELCRMKAFMLARSSTRSRLLKQQERLKYIAHELDKLSERHDRESLASIQIRFEILAFHQDSDSNFEQAYRQNVLDSGISKAQSMVASRTTRQSYVKDGFGWENFLRPSAPGFGLMHSETQPPSSVQVLPSMGMRICADLGRDEVDCIQASQDQVKRGNRALHRLPFIEPRETFANSGQRVEEQDRNRCVRMHAESMTLQKDPFTDDLGVRLNIGTHSAVKPFQELSRFIYRLEQRGPAFNSRVAALNAPNAFPLISIRSWRRPIRPDNLYHIAVLPAPEQKQRAARYQIRQRSPKKKQFPIRRRPGQDFKTSPSLRRMKVC